MPILNLLLLSMVSLATTDVRVLFFTMDSCPPCKQTEPAIDQLSGEGMPVSKIDVRQYQSYAQQCHVDRTPTVMLVDGNRVLARHTGIMDYRSLKQMVSQFETPTTVAAARTESNPPGQPPQTTKLAALAKPNDVSLGPKQQAMAATVRFRVEDTRGVSLATGTIIHRNDNEALVLTCGHVFRDSQGKGKINADIGIAIGQPSTVVGKLIFYDADKHDIALVAIPCPLAIRPVSVAKEGTVVASGAAIFSVGCDRGADPSLRNSVLKATTTYSGVKKYDIVGRPIDGRSGGGLFTSAGELIGVCNAAAVEEDEGIYTGLQSVYWQFANANLTHLFESNDSPAMMVNTEDRINRDASGQATGSLRHPSQRSPSQNVVARGDELTPPISQPVYRGGGIPVSNPVFRGNSIPTRSASFNAEEPLEMIVILRSRTDPELSETITIDGPTAETLEWLKSNGGSNRSRLAELPKLRAPESPNRVQMRGQSPR